MGTSFMGPVAPSLQVSTKPGQVHLYQAAQAASQAIQQASGSTCSFSGDTPVATADGEEPIDQLQVGDEVLAYDPASGTTGFYPVAAVLQHQDAIIEHLTINGEQLETTPEHPFDTAKRDWVAAGELQVGMHVRQADGAWGVVQAIAFEQHPQTMYNLTVQQAHTFFVGEQRVLVHNRCSAGRANKPPTPDFQFPSNPADSPGPGWIWKGKGAEGSDQGTWYNPKTNEFLHPHNDPSGHGPHWDWRAPDGSRWRRYPDGRMEPQR